MSASLIVPKKTLDSIQGVIHTVGPHSSVSRSVARSEFASRERLRRIGPLLAITGGDYAKGRDDCSILCALRCWEEARRSSQSLL